MSSLIDWDVATRAARRFSPSSPAVNRREADDVVGELYRATAVAADHVAELTKLAEPPVTAITRVIDRPAWIDTNAYGLRTIMDPLVDRLTASNPVGAVAERIGGRGAGVAGGGGAGVLSRKGSGQFVVFDRGGGGARLLGPN